MHFGVLMCVRACVCTCTFEGPRAIFNFLYGVRVLRAYDRVLLSMVLYIRISVKTNRHYDAATHKYTVHKMQGSLS